MSVDCNITVQFEVTDVIVLKQLSWEHATNLKMLADVDGPAPEEFDRDALRMLEHAAGGHGVALGPRGDMFTWGSLGNYSSLDCFVDALNPFWLELYVRRAVFDHNGIVVMFQQEQRALGRIIEITAQRVAGRPPPGLVIRELETTFPLFGWHLERPDGLLPRGVSTREVEGTRSEGRDDD